jgi:hypothetical protein
VGADGRLLVHIEHIHQQAVWAKSVIGHALVTPGLQVALAFERGQADAPIALGVLANSMPAARPQHALSNDREVAVDGERVVITAQESIELRCGDAAILLTADGHIQLRGTYVTSTASATQRIKGGSVNVN